MNKILVTGIGGDIGQSIAQCLRNTKDKVFLIGTDMHDKHGGSTFVDKYNTIPSVIKTSYLITI